MKPFSEASERNRAPILAVLKRVFKDRKRVLEIGSGTGQHAAYFAAELPHLVWQASDVAEHLPGIREWIADPAPIELDVDKPWPAVEADAVFSANTCHIMSWPQVKHVRGSELRRPSASTARSTTRTPHLGEQRALRRDAARRDPASGIRDFEAINPGERRAVLQEDNAMPANNRLLVGGAPRRAFASMPRAAAVRLAVSSRHEAAARMPSSDQRTLERQALPARFERATCRLSRRGRLIRP